MKMNVRRQEKPTIAVNGAQVDLKVRMNLLGVYSTIMAAMKERTKSTDYYCSRRRRQSWLLVPTWEVRVMVSDSARTSPTVTWPKNIASLPTSTCP